MSLAALIPAHWPDEKLVSVNEVAEMLSVTKHSVYAWVKQGRLPLLKRIGPRTLKFQAGELRAALAKMDNAGAAKKRG